MRSPRPDETRHHAAGTPLALALALAFAACASPAFAQGEAAAPAPSASAAAAPASAASAPVVAIEGAVAALRVDPLMPGKHTVRRPHLDFDTAPEPRAEPPDLSWMHWLLDFARFLNDTSRILLWGLIAALVALLLVGLRHLVQLRAFAGRRPARATVSHVRDLDVRPETLPDDVGAAAWALWRAGQVPAAMSLLYRGALSRLIHRFAVPVSSSTTEGECLALARDRIAPDALRYVTQVVRAWEANVYGQRALSDALGETLCTGFATRLDAASPKPSNAAQAPGAAA